MGGQITLYSVMMQLKSFTTGFPWRPLLARLATRDHKLATQTIYSCLIWQPLYLDNYDFFNVAFFSTNASISQWENALLKICLASIMLLC